MVSEAHDFILVSPALEEAEPRVVVQAFFGAQVLTDARLAGPQVLLSLERNVTEKYSDIFSLQDAVIVEVVPIHKLKVNHVHGSTYILNVSLIFSSNELRYTLSMVSTKALS